MAVYGSKADHARAVRALADALAEADDPQEAVGPTDAGRNVTVQP